MIGLTVDIQSNEGIIMNREGFLTAAFIITILNIGAISALMDSSYNLNQSIDEYKVTTSWNLSSIFHDRGAAEFELQRLKADSERLNITYRPKFKNLTGPILFNWIEDQKNLSRELEILSAYASGENSLNVSDESFGVLLSDIQDLSVEHYKNSSFATIKLESMSKSEWDRLFFEEPRLEKYRPYLEESFIRYANHRPVNETQAAQIANLSNQLAKIETAALKNITSNVMVAGNITLISGQEYPVDSRSYIKLLSTDVNRSDRKKCYDKRFYHTLNLSGEMAEIYSRKAGLDDSLAREMNFTDSYQARLFGGYLTEAQIEEMNEALKERKGDFDRYYEFRRTKLGLEELMPYDLNIQLMKDPDRKLNYTDCLIEIERSYAGMDPLFNQAFSQEINSSSIDVYPRPGKQPGGYTTSMAALSRPSLIFLNFKGLIQDEKTMTHEMGHAINYYLMSNAVDYLYCDGTDYEAEVPATFNEELFLDYAIQNYDKDTTTAVLAQQIDDYANYFTFQPAVAEFEHQAHKLYDKQGRIDGVELNSLWTNVSGEFRSSKIGYYDQGSAEWTMIRHIFFANNYYTFNYALSKAITLSLFKKYKEDPDEFNKNYIAYLSAGTTMAPDEKLRRYFGLEINRKLFEDAMDVVKLRVGQLEELNRMA